MQRDQQGTEPRIFELDMSAMQWMVEPVSRRSMLSRGAGALAGATLLGALVGCGSDDNSSTSSASGSTSQVGGKPGEGKTIAVSLNGFNTYDQNFATGCLKALEGTAYKFIGAEAQFDASQEVANIKQLVARQPDGLVVLAVTADGAARACVDAKKAGIPVVAAEFFPTTKDADSVFYAATQLAPDRGGQLTIDAVTKDAGVTAGKILEITGLDAQPYTVGYSQGIRKALKAYPDLKIVSTQQGLYTADGALKVLKPMLAAHPDAKVIIDYAADMSVAIAQELERQGLKDIIHIGDDANDDLIPWFAKENGAYLYASRWYSAAEFGLSAVRILRNKLENEEDPTTENVGLDGWELVPGTKDPIVVNAREEIATAKNIKSLPPYSYPTYVDKIPFGA